jgi:hypothetical protein
VIDSDWLKSMPARSPLAVKNAPTPLSEQAPPERTRARRDTRTLLFVIRMELAEAGESR